MNINWSIGFYRSCCRPTRQRNEPQANDGLERIGCVNCIFSLFSNITIGEFINNLSLIKLKICLWNYFIKCEITKEIKITMKEIMWLGDKRQKIGKYHQILLILSLFLRGLYRAEGLRQQIDWDGLEEMGERPIPLLMIKLHKQMSCRLELYPFQSLEQRRYIQNEKLLLLFRNSQTLNSHYFKTIL